MVSNRNGTVRPGMLDRKVALQRFTAGRDEYGGEVETWTTIRTIWAEVVPMKVSEMFISGATRPEKITVFRTWYSTDIGEKDRILYEAKTYDIRGISEIGRHEGLNIMAELIE